MRDQWSFIIAIHLNSPKESAIQSLFVYCAARVVNGSPKIKVITQKCQIQNRGFFISEMYGLGDLSKSDNESKECVICMTNPRDTCVLPCRHVCCCAECANTLRLQSDKCPVCRKPITELVYLTVNPDYLNVQKGADGSRNVEMQSLWRVCLSPIPSSLTLFPILSSISFPLTRAVIVLKKHANCDDATE